MRPSLADHVTDVLYVPETLALNCVVAPRLSVAEEGDMAIEIVRLRLRDEEKAEEAVMEKRRKIAMMARNVLLTKRTMYTSIPWRALAR